MQDCVAGVNVSVAQAAIKLDCGKLPTCSTASLRASDVKFEAARQQKYGKARSRHIFRVNNSNKAASFPPLVIIKVAALVIQSGA